MTGHALYLRSVCPFIIVFHGLRCHPLTCIVLKLRLRADSIPSGAHHLSAFVEEWPALVCDHPSRLSVESYKATAIKKREVDNVRAEIISRGNRSRSPLFEKHKGWGSLSCDNVSTERVGQPPSRLRRVSRAFLWMSIRSDLGNWIARHNQLLWFRSNGQRLERSQVAHPSTLRFRFPARNEGAPSLRFLQGREAVSLVP